MRVSSSPGALYAPGPPVRSGSQRLCTREGLVERTARVLGHGTARLDSAVLARTSEKTTGLGPRTGETSDRDHGSGIR
jgi:hypothetical protein